MPKTFDKVLIANRGEIACRVIRTCRALDIRTVAVYSDADARSRHVQMADEAFRVGTPLAKDSYLLADRILDVAHRSGAQAIHPGYGFLSENESFANACEKAGVAFIGPPASAIRDMGSKSASKRIMIDSGVPVVPGYHGDDQSIERLRAEAGRVGYPVMIKAVHGGGGKGMRIAHTAEEFDECLASAKRESLSSFGNDDVLVERYIRRPRHIEFQVFADKHGNAVHLFERDCSVQRRHQKVLEEAPAPGMTPELRAKMGQSAVDAARAVGYVGAGTVEFIFDADTDEYFFMEMNTRLQVEHCVSEMITRRDFVQLQLHVAAGHPFTAHYTQDAINRDVRGHAIEARVYAEDPSHNFLPAVGRLVHLVPPPSGPGSNTRVETGVRQGDEVSMYYDPMISKLVVWAPDRARALASLDRALGQYQIVGPVNNVGFLQRCVTHPVFAAGRVDTGFIAAHQKELLPAHQHVETSTVALAALAVLQQEARDAAAAARLTPDPFSPWAAQTHLRLNDPRPRRVRLVATEGGAGPAAVAEDAAETKAVTEAQNRGAFTCDITHDGHGSSSSYTMRVHRGWLRAGLAENRAEPLVVSGTVAPDGTMHATVGGRAYTATVVRHGHELHVFADGRHTKFTMPVRTFGGSSGGKGASAPMSGRVVKVVASPGQHVKAGQTIMVMEAMKMETTIKANRSGVLKKIMFSANDLVQGGDTLFVIEGDDAE